VICKSSVITAGNVRRQRLAACSPESQNPPCCDHRYGPHDTLARHIASSESCWKHVLCVFPDLGSSLLRSNHREAETPAAQALHGVHQSALIASFFSNVDGASLIAIDNWDITETRVQATASHMYIRANSCHWSWPRRSAWSPRMSGSDSSAEAAAAIDAIGPTAWNASDGSSENVSWSRVPESIDSTSNESIEGEVDHRSFEGRRSRVWTSAAFRRSATWGRTPSDDEELQPHAISMRKFSTHELFGTSVLESPASG
jgi:hypothetical protein